MKPDFDTVIGSIYSEYNAITDEDEKETFWYNLSDKDKYLFNKEYLIQTQKPEYDYLVCWEPGRLDENESICNFNNMYEFDYAWWTFQKEAELDSINQMKKWMENGSEYHTPDKVARAINYYEEKYNEYSMYCTGDWIRLIENDTCIYGQLISAKWYIYYELEMLLDDLIDKQIPWTFKGDTSNWLDAINANTPEDTYEAKGRERELERLKKEVSKLLNETILNSLDERLKAYGLDGKTFRYDRGYEDTENANFDPFTDYIFMDVESLKNIDPKHFVNDFKKYQGDSVDFDKIILDFKEQTIRDFKEIYDINTSKYI